MDGKSMNYWVCVLFVAGLAGSAMAEPLDFAPEWRGQERTTLQMWNFDDGNDLNPLPDVYEGPFNRLPAEVQPLGAWEDGAWPLSGRIFLPIENWPQPLEYKEIWVQLTWKFGNGSRPEVKAYLGEPGQSEYVSPRLVSEDRTTLDPWVFTVYSLIIEPNPPFETVKIGGGIWVDAVKIETICAPEPATMVMLAMGGLVVLSRRRRRRRS